MLYSEKKAMNKQTTALSGKRFLIAEDDSFLRDAIQNVLLKLNARVKTAENGLVAKAIFDLNPQDFDLVLSDIRMPEMDGLQLLKHVKEHAVGCKVLIFTGFSELLETTSAADLGADGFLAKPFQLAELVSAIDAILNPTSHGNTESLGPSETQKYCCVPVSEFFSSSKLPSDIYVKVGTTKFIKIARESDEIEIERLRHFQEHKVDYLYVKTDEFHKYTGLSLKIAGVVASSPGFSEEKKLRLFKHTSEMLIQETFFVSINQGLCEGARRMLENTLRTVAANDDLFELLFSLHAKSDLIYSHSLTVALYACLIASKMGWTSPQSQYKIALSALFHDIGFRELPDDLYNRPRHKMSAEEIKVYESHPLRGKDILLSVPGYPSDLAMIVVQHHETLVGTGYPLGLNSLKIHPLAKLIRLADEVVDRVTAGRVEKKQDIAIILNDLLETRREEFDFEMLCASYDLFDLDRPAKQTRKTA